MSNCTNTTMEVINSLSEEDYLAGRSLRHIRSSSARGYRLNDANQIWSRENSLSSNLPSVSRDYHLGENLSFLSRGNYNMSYQTFQPQHNASSLAEFPDHLSSGASSMPYGYNVPSISDVSRIIDPRVNIPHQVIHNHNAAHPPSNILLMNHIHHILAARRAIYHHNLRVRNLATVSSSPSPSTYPNLSPLNIDSHINSIHRITPGLHLSPSAPQSDPETGFRNALSIPEQFGSGATEGRSHISSIRSLAATNMGSFPERLHKLLEDADADCGFSNTISFLEHGRAFRIHDMHTFKSKIMPRYFQLSKWSSMQRQLDLYGFIRIGRGVYYHEKFLRGKSELCAQIKRTKIKGTSPGRKKENGFVVPDFHSMGPIM